MTTAAKKQKSMENISAIAGRMVDYIRNSDEWIKNKYKNGKLNYLIELGGFLVFLDVDMLEPDTYQNFNINTEDNLDLDDQYMMASQVLFSGVVASMVELQKSELAKVMSEEDLIAYPKNELINYIVDIFYPILLPRECQGLPVDESINVAFCAHDGDNDINGICLNPLYGYLTVLYKFGFDIDKIMDIIDGVVTDPLSDLEN